MTKTRIPFEKLDARIAELEELKARKEEFDKLPSEDKIVEHLIDKLLDPYACSVWGVEEDYRRHKDTQENRIAFAHRVASLVDAAGTNDYQTLYNILKAVDIL